MFQGWINEGVLSGGALAKDGLIGWHSVGEVVPESFLDRGKDGELCSGKDFPGFECLMKFSSLFVLPEELSLIEVDKKLPSCFDRLQDEPDLLLVELTPSVE